MNNELITLGTAIEWAKAEIKIEGEDFVYGADRREDESHVIDCYYYEADGTPSCIVGRILDRHDLMTFEGSRGDEGTGTHMLPAVTNNFTCEAQDFLAALQEEQDKGETWGLALENAIERVCGK